MHSVRLNGIDPDGESPPDEVIHDADDGLRVELLRVAPGRQDWEVRVHPEHGTYRHWGFDAFGRAFAWFARCVEEDGDS